MYEPPNPLRPRTESPAAGAVLLLLALCVVGLLTAFPAAAQDPNSDDMIYDRVIRKLVNDPDLKTNALEITVSDRVVTVTGVVAKEKLRSRVEKVIKDVKGVKDVVNRVTVRT
jgi:osmotically-inducible protein OsmY